MRRCFGLLKDTTTKGVNNMTLSTATRILDSYSMDELGRDEVTLATIAHALYVVHQEANRH